MKFIAGPCVIESAELLDAVAERLAAINRRLGTEIIFKASFDKANRTSLGSFRGPGIDRGLQMLADVRSKWGLNLLTDIHEAWQAAPAGQVVDVLQIPAFLCRQTDLLVAAAKTGKTVNIKKAQFLSGADMRYPYDKARESGAPEIWLTERGNSFGYNNLVVDFRNIPDMLQIARRSSWTAPTRSSAPGPPTAPRAATASSCLRWPVPLRRSARTVTSSRCIPTPTMPRATAPTCCGSTTWNS